MQRSNVRSVASKMGVVRGGGGGGGWLLVPDFDLEKLAAMLYNFCPYSLPQCLAFSNILMI